MMLDREDIEAIAAEVVELLGHHDPRHDPDLIDAAELARRFGMERSWVYSHAAELGAVRLGAGPNSRLRFDPRRAAQALTPIGAPPAPPPPPPRRPARRRSPGGKVALLPVKGEKGFA